MADYESILLVKNEVFVYQIPPRASNRSYRAADWKLDAPAFTGRMRLVSKGDNVFLRVEDRDSCALWAQCPIEQYPGPSIESVSDSSRYFVIRVVSDRGDKAFVGLGFADRGDSFDLNVSLQDHFKRLKNDSNPTEAETSQGPEAPKLDLSFKAGQTITVNFAGQGGNSSRKKPTSSNTGGILLPPPPAGGAKPRTGSVPGILPPPPGAAPTAPVQLSNIAQSQQHITPDSSNKQFAPTREEWGDFL